MDYISDLMIYIYSVFCFFFFKIKDWKLKGSLKKFNLSNCNVIIEFVYQKYKNF